MADSQQKEALNYFNAHSAEWGRDAESTDPGEVNVIQQRNDFVLDALAARPETRGFLDVGCGTGELVREAAGRGIASLGLDFAEGMIKIARDRAAKEGASRARFECASVFDFPYGAERFDAISANGFIEYISLEEFGRFVDLAHRLLNPGGSFVVGSRNRLFNLFSLNSFTLKEIEDGTAEALLRECVALASSEPLENLSRLKTAPLQRRDAVHTNTGIDVATRFQYTPAQLAGLLEPRGFTVKELFPIHSHGIPPAFKNKHPEVHAAISRLLYSHGREGTALVPGASSFMMHAVKRHP